MGSRSASAQLEAPCGRTWRSAVTPSASSIAKRTTMLTVRSRACTRDQRPRAIRKSAGSNPAGATERQLPRHVRVALRREDVQLVAPERRGGALGGRAEIRPRARQLDTEEALACGVARSSSSGVSRRARTQRYVSSRVQLPCPAQSVVGGSRLQLGLTLSKKKCVRSIRPKIVDGGGRTVCRFRNKCRVVCQPYLYLVERVAVVGARVKGDSNTVGGRRTKSSSGWGWRRVWNWYLRESDNEYDEHGDSARGARCRCGEGDSCSGCSLPGTCLESAATGMSSALLATT